MGEQAGAVDWYTTLTGVSIDYLQACWDDQDVDSGGLV
jgi:hypothetical protein